MDIGLEMYRTQEKIDGAAQPRNGARNGPVSKHGPVFRSLNISTFLGLKSCNGPIIFIIVITGL